MYIHMYHALLFAYVPLCLCVSVSMYMHVCTKMFRFWCGTLCIIMCTVYSTGPIVDLIMPLWLSEVMDVLIIGLMDSLHTRTCATTLSLTFGPTTTTTQAPHCMPVIPLSPFRSQSYHCHRPDYILGNEEGRLTLWKVCACESDSLSVCVHIQRKGENKLLPAGVDWHTYAYIKS